MKTKFQKFLSVICIFTLLLTSVSGFAIAETADDVSIITAQFLPYEQEIRVLASVPTGYTGKVLVNGEEVASTSSTSDDNILYTASYTPTVYGIVPVTLEATKDGITISDTENVKVLKISNKEQTLFEDFSKFEPTEMQSDGDTVIKDLFATNDVTLINLPNSNTSRRKRFLDIKDSYDTNDTNIAVYRFEASTTAGLPTFRINPTVDNDGYVSELKFDIYPTSRYVRMAIGGKNTDSQDIYFNGAATYQLLNYDNQCFGNSDIPVVGDTWYNIRFILNSLDFTYELYVNDLYVDKGYITYKNGSTDISGVNYFDVSAGVQGAAGASSTTPVELAIDNIAVNTYIPTINPNAISYTTDNGTVDAELINAKIPFNTVDTISIEFDGIVSANTVTVKDSKGNTANADISETNDGTNSTLTLSDMSLSPNTVYTLVCGDIQIPFTAISEAVVFSPVADTKVNKGTDVNLSACTPDAKYVDIFVNGTHVATPVITDECVSYLYGTSSETLGKKNVEFVIHKNDGTTKILTTSFVVNDAKEADITPLDTFADFSSLTEYKTAHSNIRASIDALTRETAVSSAAIAVNDNNSFRVSYIAAKAAKGKALWIQDTFDKAYSGRIVFEHDLYIEDTAGTLNYCFTGTSGTTTGIPFYALNDSSLFAGGKIGTHVRDYGNGWNKIKIVIDTVKQSSEVYFNGELVTSNNNFTGALKGVTYNKMDSCANLRITYLKGSAATIGNEYLAFAIDNWRVYKEYPLPAISNVTAYDTNANSAALSEGSLISNSVNKFKLDLSNSIYANTNSLLSNITLALGNIVVEKENAVLSDGVLTFDVANLPENADLKLTIGANTALYDDTTIGTDTVFNLKVADKNGLYAKKEISTEGSNVKAIYKLDALSEKSLNLIIATYNGNELVDVTVKPVTFANSQNISLTLPKAGTNKAKVFVWANDGIKPLLAGNSEINY